MEALDLGAFDFVVKPSGGNPQANADKLRQELGFKIEAFRKAREIRAILHGPPSQPAVAGALSAAAEIPATLRAGDTRLPPPTARPISPAARLSTRG